MAFSTVKMNDKEERRRLGSECCFLVLVGNHETIVRTERKEVNPWSIDMTLIKGLDKVVLSKLFVREPIRPATSCIRDLTKIRPDKLRHPPRAVERYGSNPRYG